MSCSSRAVFTSRAMRSIAQSHELLLPRARPRRAVPHLRQAPIVDDVLLEGDALGAERALVDRMIGIAFDVDDRRLDVARPVAERVDDHAAADRAVRAGRARFGRARDLQLAHLRQRRAADRSRAPTPRRRRCGDLQKLDVGSRAPASAPAHVWHVRLSACPRAGFSARPPEKVWPRPASTVARRIRVSVYPCFIRRAGPPPDRSLSARRAGTTVATNAPRLPAPAAIATSVGASLASTLKSRPLTRRPPASVKRERRQPGRARPAAGLRPAGSGRHRCRPAPSARRMPISGVRCPTR